MCFWFFFIFGVAKLLSGKVVDMNFNIFCFQHLSSSVLNLVYRLGLDLFLLLFRTPGNAQKCIKCQIKLKKY